MIILSAFISAAISWLVETSADAASQWLRERWEKRKHRDSLPFGNASGERDSFASRNSKHPNQEEDS